jgi:MFS family permease
MAKKTGFSLNKRILLVILGICALSQLAFLYVNVSAFRQGYLQVVQSNLVTAGSSLQTQLSRVIQKGISIDSLVGLKPLLTRVFTDVDELHRVSVVTEKGRVLYTCTRDAFYDELALQSVPEILRQAKTPQSGTIRLPLTGKAGETVGYLVLQPSRKIIAKNIRDIVLDSATIIVISLLAIVDLLFFIVAYTVGLPVATAGRDIEAGLKKGVIDYPARRTKIDFIDHLLDLFDCVRFDLNNRWIRIQTLGRSLIAGNAHQEAAWKKLQKSLERLTSLSGSRQPLSAVLSPALIRPAIFLSVFSEAIAVSFLPLYAHQIYQPMLGLPQQVIIGLPIAVYMFTFALSLPISGAWTDVFGRRRLYLAGAAISTIGLVACGLGSGIVSLIIARGIVGMGNGALYMATQGYILDTTSIENRAEGLAIHLTAFYSGTMCGTALGSMLADHLGYQNMFFFGSVISLAAVFFVYMFVTEPHQPVGAPFSIGQTIAQRMKGAFPKAAHIKELLANRNFVAISLLQAMPNKICLIGLVFFAAPILLKAGDVGQSDIGRVVSIYSLLMVLLSQAVSRWSDRIANTKNLLFWGGLIPGFAFLPFFFTASPWVVIGAITVLGLAHSLTVSNQAKLASHLQSVQQIGLGPGLGLYRQIERLGNVLATLIIGALASSIGFSKALGVVGATLILTSLLFGLLFRKEE